MQFRTMLKNINFFYDALLFKQTLTNNAIILFSEDHFIESVSKLILWYYPLLAIVLDYPLDYVSSSASQRKPA